MAHRGTIQIRCHMLTIVENFRDDCGEINATGLAEATCADLNGWDGDEIPEKFFEVAGALAVADENRHQTHLPAALRNIINRAPSSWL